MIQLDKKNTLDIQKPGVPGLRHGQHWNSVKAQVVLRPHTTDDISSTEYRILLRLSLLISISLVPMHSILALSDMQQCSITLDCTYDALARVERLSTGAKLGLSLVSWYPLKGIIAHNCYVEIPPGYETAGCHPVWQARSWNTLSLLSELGKLKQYSEHL